MSLITGLVLAAAVSGVDKPTSEPKLADPSDEVRIGALASAGFPRPLGVEAMIKMAGVLAIGAEYSMMPQVSVGGVETKWHAYAADVRVFPFSTAPFFVGARIGRQRAESSATVTYLSRSYSGTSTIDTTFINPRLGFLWTWSSGFSVGIDAGLQIPLSHKSSTQLPAGVSIPESALSTATSASEYVGAKVIPTVTLLQLGMLL